MSAVFCPYLINLLGIEPVILVQVSSVDVTLLGLQTVIFRPICPLSEYFIYMYFHAKPYFLTTPKTKYFSFFTTRISWKLLPCFIYSYTRVYKSSIFRMSRMKILGHFYNMDNLLLTEDGLFCLGNSSANHLMFVIGWPWKGPITIFWYNFRL